MNTMYLRLLLVFLPILLSACDSRGPTQPSAVTQPSPGANVQPRVNQQTFEVAGVVTDERGAPMPGAVVTMRHWRGGFVHAAAVKTDSTGNYQVGFTASPLGNGFVARAEVMAEGYEEYWRSIMDAPSGTTVVESFRLQRPTRIPAGDSVTLSVPADVGECRGWVAEVCPIVRVSVPKDGNLQIEVVASDGSAPSPPVEVCCVDGNERYGNPVTVPVAAGVELEVKVGMRRGLTTNQSIVVKTAFETF